MGFVGRSPSRVAPAEGSAGASRLVARWDLDKTYLRTEFDTLSDLVRTAVEKPEQKRAVPGASTLLRELGRTGCRIHIVSGSPRQMRKRLEAKLRIDHVRWDELTLKPNLGNALRLRFRALRDQLGYKLPEMLDARVRDQARGPSGAFVEEILVGDDAEADAFVYSLYADLCEGAVTEKHLRRVLKKGRLYPDQVERCLAARSRIERGLVVRRILIHLDRQSRPSRFDRYGPRVVPFYNYLQAAFVLAEDGVLGPEGALRVAADLSLRHRFEADALARSYLDLMRRGHVHRALPPSLETALATMTEENASLPAGRQLKEMCEKIVAYEPDERSPPEPRLKRVDYVDLAERHRGGRNRKRVRTRLFE